MPAYRAAAIRFGSYHPGMAEPFDTHRQHRRGRFLDLTREAPTHACGPLPKAEMSVRGPSEIEPARGAEFIRIAIGFGETQLDSLTVAPLSVRRGPLCGSIEKTLTGPAEGGGAAAFIGNRVENRRRILQTRSSFRLTSPLRCLTVGALKAFVTQNVLSEQPCRLKPCPARLSRQRRFGAQQDHCGHGNAGRAALPFSSGHRDCPKMGLGPYRPIHSSSSLPKY